MKIKHEWPPNIDRIKEVLNVDKPGIVFTYGDTIYCPTSPGPLSPDLIVHEETHEVQQAEMGIDVWWEHYLTNWKFRLGVEVEAYHNQYKSLSSLTRDHRRFITKQLATALCSPMYGNIVTKEVAIQLVKRGME